MASNQNFVWGERLPKNCQESQDIMSLRIIPRKIQKRLLGNLSPQGDPKVQEILLSKLPKGESFKKVLKEIQRSKRSILSKLPRGASVQELPREVHIIRSRAFPHNIIYLYCKRPIVGANKPSVVKANLVQACNRQKGLSCIAKRIMKVSVTCQSCAIILHHSRNLP